MYFFDSDNRVNGISLFINGGLQVDGMDWQSLDKRDNEIRLSCGGASVFSPATTNLVALLGKGNYGEASRWLPGNWYQVEIANINLSPTGEGTNVTAIVNMWRTSDNVYKITNQPIIASGTGAGPFNKINALRLVYPSNWGNRNYYFDDFEILSTPARKETLLFLR